MSRAFTKEDDDVTSVVESDLETHQLREWLAMQEKKLHFLEHDPKAQEVPPEKRALWIEHARQEIEKARKQLLAHGTRPQA